MSDAAISMLKGCAKDLAEIRAQLPNNLEPSVVTQLDSVLARLEQVEKTGHDRQALMAVFNDVLALAGRVAEIALVVSQFVDRCN